MLPLSSCLQFVTNKILATCFHAAFLLDLFFDPEDGGDVSLKRRLTFNEIHGVLSRKIELLKKLWICSSFNNSNQVCLYQMIFSLSYQSESKTQVLLCLDLSVYFTETTLKELHTFQKSCSNKIPVSYNKRR
jgi:hypothetical protein